MMTKEEFIEAFLSVTPEIQEALIKILLDNQEENAGKKEIKAITGENIANRKGA